MNGIICRDCSYYEKREQLKDKTKDCPHFHICEFAYMRGYEDARALYRDECTSYTIEDYHKDCEESHKRTLEKMASKINHMKR